MSFYRALIHTAIKCYADEYAVVECEIELPDFWRPRRGEWLSHPFLDGRCQIWYVGYDAYIGRPVIVLKSGAQSPDMTLAEWLTAHGHWNVPQHSPLRITPDGKIQFEETYVPNDAASTDGDTTFGDEQIPPGSSDQSDFSLN